MNSPPPADQPATTPRPSLNLATLSRAFTEVAVVGLVIADVRGKITAVNPATTHIFGYSSEEMVGQDLSMLMPSPDRERHHEYIRSYLETGHAKIIGIGREVRGQRKDGSCFPVDLAIAEIHLAEGHFFVGTVRDISDRKDAEEEVRKQRDFAESLVDTAHAIVLLLDREGRIVRFNRYMEEISGYRLGEVAQQDWFDTFVPREEHEALRRIFASTLDGEPLRGHVNPIRTRGGETREIEWHAVAQRDGLGSITGVLAIGQDITGRRSLEEQLRRSQKMAALGRLAAALAHDFNTVVASILGYSEMLLRPQSVNDEQTRHLHQIRRAAERGAALTRQLLSFSRPSITTPQILDLTTVIAGVSEMVERLIGHGVELVEEADPELWRVRAGRIEIEQVVMNLLLNARDAVGSAGQIVIETCNVPHERAPMGLAARDWVLLAVTDNGCGMDEETRAHAFDPFFTTKPAGQGTGLGLAVVYGVVHELGGEIMVHSAPDQGSRFEIYLPRVPADAFDPAGASSPVATSETSATPPTLSVQRFGSGKTVLVVEDDQLFREMLSEFLEEAGCVVLAAASPRLALETVDRHERGFDLLITDFILPEMNGLELARRIQDTHHEIKVLILSGSASAELAERAQTEGHTFFAKPFSTAALAAAITRLLGDESSAGEAPP